MLNGRQMDRLTREESLNALLEKLTAVGQLELGLIARKYLLACMELYRSCVRKQLDPDYKLKINNFRVQFDILFDMGLLNMTPKVPFYQFLWDFIHNYFCLSGSYYFGPL